MILGLAAAAGALALANGLHCAGMCGNGGRVRPRLCETNHHFLWEAHAGELGVEPSHR